MKIAIITRKNALVILIVSLLASSGANDISCRSSKLLECNKNNDETSRSRLVASSYSSNWFCRYQDQFNKKDIRKHIETWFRIVSDKQKDLITTELDGLEPFQSFNAPHIDIYIGYIANRKRFMTMKYRIFKSTKLLHEGVMMNGNIYANVSIDQLHDWVGTIKIVIGSQEWILSGERKNIGILEIQAQLYKSKLHGIVRIWGKFPKDPNDNCRSKQENGLGLICKYSNGFPYGK